MSSKTQINMSLGNSRVKVVGLVVDVDVDFDPDGIGGLGDLRGRQRIAGRSVMMSYEKLDVYQCAIKFLSLAFEITSEMPRGQAALADPLKRAAMSVALSIAEGAGKRTRADCGRFFDIARGSAMECAAAIDVCRVLNLVDEQKQLVAKQLLHRVVAMLTKLARPK